MFVYEAVYLCLLLSLCLIFSFLSFSSILSQRFEMEDVPVCIKV